MTSSPISPPASPDAVGVSERVRLARAALAAALATPGVAGGRSGPSGLRTTGDVPAPLTGIAVTAAPGGTYEIVLCLASELVPLEALADRVRARVAQAAAVVGLADLVRSVDVEFVDVVGP
jgi:hypothetical protein